MFPSRPEHLHHAYIVEGGREAMQPQLFQYLNETFNMRPGHPDLFIFSSDSLGVDQVSMIIDANMRRPIAGSKKFIVADFSSISHQAQNSLLKTLEEPQPGTHIFLLAPSASVFLPTILSRVHVVSSFSAGLDEGSNGKDQKKGQKGDPQKDDIQARAEDFLKKDPASRLAIIKDILAEKDKENIDDAYIIQFVSHIEKKLHSLSTFSAEKGAKEMSAGTLGGLKALALVDTFMRDASSSKKLLLEYLALKLPVV